MVLIPPATSQGAIATIGADRSPMMQVFPAIPQGGPETLRPILATEGGDRLWKTSIPVTGKSAHKNSTSPMGLILEALFRHDQKTSGADDASLVPPVPMRYLSAFMLQSVTQSGETIDQRL